jgi:uncharacterized damage-inducible protein DinB
MALTKDDLREHLEYSSWANRLILDACEELTTEEFERDLGASHGGVAGTVRHLYYAERLWLTRLLHQPPQYQDPAPGPSVADLQERWPEIWRGFAAWADGLAESDLVAELHSRRMNGDEFRMAQWKVIMHVVNHSTLHRGQVMGMLRQLGKKAPSTDIFLYYLTKKAASAG